MLARYYRPVDPGAAADWIDRLGPARTFDDALYYAQIYLAAGRRERARAALASRSATEEWERSCIAQLFPRGVGR